MNPGRLRHRVTIQEPTETADTYGQPLLTWSTVCTCWAHVNPISGRERIDAAMSQSTVSHRITIRHRDGITPRMRVVYGDRTFGISAVINVAERDAEMILDCTEVISV